MILLSKNCTVTEGVLEGYNDGFNDGLLVG